MKTRHQNGERAAFKGAAQAVHGSSAAATRAKAFTLIETLVAMAVVGIMVGALYTAITLGFSSVRTARENLRATQILIEKVEVIRLLSWTQVTNNILPATFVAYYDPIGATNGKGRGATYNGTIEVKQFPTAKNYQPDMKEVTVTVDWTTGRVKHSRKLKTQVALYGIQNYVYN
jgi:prepilin-type N-terminal cleavage/methylation domain-containing protein